MGFIDRVVTKTIPYRKFTRLYRYLHGNIVEFLDSLAWMQEWSGAWPSHFCALVGHGRTLSEFGFQHSDQREAEDHLNIHVSNHLPAPSFKGVCRNYRFELHRSLISYIRSDKGAHRVWADYALDYPNFRRFLPFVTALRFKGFWGVFWIGSTFWSADVLKPQRHFLLRFAARFRLPLSLASGSTTRFPGMIGERCSR